jgi:hypothetical protein
VSDGIAALLEALPIDATAVIQRVAQQLLGQAPPDADEARSTEDVLAAAIGGWLSGSGSIPTAMPVAIETTARDLVCDDLLDRDGELAAALGACECWGEDPGCPWCDGLGSPGWTPPDRRLFAFYVHPAIHALRGTEPPSRRSRARHQLDDHRSMTKGHLT